MLRQVLTFISYRDKEQSSSDSLAVEFKMSALSSLLKKQSEQNPSASYFNVDILKYQVSMRITFGWAGDVLFFI